MSGLPGVKVGPLDPDKTADFGVVSQRNSARQLVRLHTQAYPASLVSALARPLDEERSLALDMEEVAEHLDGLTLANGDPVVPDGCRVVGANVRGDRDREQVLTFTYQTPSGRTAKWFTEYSEASLPVSFADGADRVRIADLRKRGIAVVGGESAGGHVSTDAALQRENAKLQRKLDELTSGKLDGLLRERIAALSAEDLARVAAGEDPEEAAEVDGDPEDENSGEAPAPSAAQDPPFDGYDDKPAPELVKLLKADDTSDEERQAILDYEKTHHNRKSVVGAAEQQLGARGSAD